ncbi:hypothetical protein [Micromonospora coxensis]|uniref:hypothetical protein n=1 Tax=Micromonospora coxensis TaxID=356852 RepID=UPI003422A851
MLTAIGTAMLSVILFREVNTRPPTALADSYGSTFRRALVLLTLSLIPALLRLRPGSSEPRRSPRGAGFRPRGDPSSRRTGCSGQLL